jgi:hypothetical protein
LLAAFAVGVACFGCQHGASLGAGIGYTLPFLPVTFTIDTHGNIAIQGNASIVTPVGTFTLTANVSQNMAPAQDGTLLIIRHKNHGAIVDSVYNVQNQEVDAVVNGRVVLKVTNGRIFVDASQAQVLSIRVQSAAQSPSPPPPVPGAIQSPDVSIKSIAWSPDGTEIADAGETGDSTTPTVAEVRQVSSGAVLSVHRGATYYIATISWSPDGQHIASSDPDCYCVQVWNPSTGQTTVATPNGNGQANWISWSSDSKFFVTSANGDAPTVWNAESGSQVNTHEGTQAFGVYPALWSHAGTLIADNGEIWDGLSNQTVRVMDDFSPDSPSGAESWSPDGKEIISAQLGSVLLWDTGSGATIWKQQISAYLISWSPDGKYVAWVDDGGQGGIVTAASGAPAGSFQTPDGSNFDALAWSPDGHYIATASGGAIQLWQAPS